jgi:hypothetical protein
MVVASLVLSTCCAQFATRILRSSLRMGKMRKFLAVRIALSAQCDRGRSALCESSTKGSPGRFAEFSNCQRTTPQKMRAGTLAHFCTFVQYVFLAIRGNWTKRLWPLPLSWQAIAMARYAVNSNSE